MGKTIRPAYPAQFSMGLLILVFLISSFLSSQIFDIPLHELNNNKSVYLGMFLVGSAVIIMILIIWEEILFPIRVKAVEDGVIFRNHRTKLKAQILIYLSLPAIFIFIYTSYNVNLVRFVIWAGICLITPVIEKIFSGLNNFNDYLKFTNKIIEYKNNEKEGHIYLSDIQSISIINDDRNEIKKMELHLLNNENVIIDLDEMELEAFYDSIKAYTKTNYKHLLK